MQIRSITIAGIIMLAFSLLGASPAGAERTTRATALAWAKEAGDASPTVEENTVPRQTGGPALAASATNVTLRGHFTYTSASPPEGSPLPSGTEVELGVEKGNVTSVHIPRPEVTTTTASAARV